MCDQHSLTCADPGIFVKGGPGQSAKKSSDNFFFFLVLSLFYRSQMVNFKEIYHLSRFQRGSNFFQGGGSNCLWTIETHITCDFSGGSAGPPVPPLDPHLASDQPAQTLEYSMSVELLIEHHLEFLSLQGGCTGSSESTLV